MYKILFSLVCLSLNGFSQTRYEITPGTANVRWGGKTELGGGHEGLLSLKSGFITTSSDGLISGGEFMMDMTTIRNTENKDKKKGEDDMLDEHLKSDDFFSTKTFPTALFSITTVTPDKKSIYPDQVNVKGLLTIKGIANAITFPASVKVGKSALIKATFSIDRTRWGIVYKAKSILSGADFFGKAKDDIIQNDLLVILDLKLEAVKTN